jgi:putative peptidoglycan lipid II flippase
MAELVPGEGKLHAVLDLAVVGLLYLGIYLGLAKVLRITEVTDVMRLVTSRLGSKR